MFDNTIFADSELNILTKKMKRAAVLPRQQAFKKIERLFEAVL